MRSTSRQFEIAGRPIGIGHRPYLIAELSGNHNGNIERAFALMEAAAKAGADAIKLQTYTADTLTIDHRGPGFIINDGLWKGRSLYELYKKAHTPWAWHERLFAKGQQLGVTVFSTPFDESAVDFLERLDAPAYKIASFEAGHMPLLRRIAATGKPVILSTGMADLGEIEKSVQVLHASGCRELMLLHCVSGYPTPPAETNLRTIPHLADAFNLPVGLSDHTLGNAVAVAAVSLNAVAVEKHFTLDRADGGPDAAFSVEPEEFAALADGVRIAWEALGRINYDRAPSEQGNVIFRRSIYAVRDIGSGESLTPDNIRVIRPGFGLAPRHYDELIGRRARGRIGRGTPIGWDLVE